MSELLQHLETLKVVLNLLPSPSATTSRPQSVVAPRLANNPS